MMILSRPIQIIIRVSLGLAVYAALFVLTTPVAFGQETTADKSSAQASTNAPAAKSQPVTKDEAKPVALPVFKEYRGVKISMKADEVRGMLADALKSKGNEQDLFVFGGGETATVYYDKSGAVKAVSVDFPAKSTKAPSAKDVLGEEIQAKDDGSMYSLVRYPEAGYWVAYSRTSGDSPLVTVTIQKMR